MTRTGAASPAEARSAERTAKPSTLERSNGGTSIGATMSSRQRAAERAGKRPQLARNRARKQGGFESLKRVLARKDRQELILIHIVAALRQGRLGHVGTHISPATYRHRPACPQQNPRPRPAQRAMRRRGRSHRSDSSPTASGSQWPSRCFEQHDLGDADAGGDLALKRQGDRLPRQKRGQGVQHRQRQRPPRRQRLIRRAGQCEDGDLSNPADGGGPARLQRDAVGNYLATLGQRCDRGIGAADAAATDRDQQIACACIERRGDRCGIAPRGLSAGDSRRRRRGRCPRSAAPSLLRPKLAGISTTRRRGRRTFNSCKPTARATSRSSGRTRLPSGDDDASFGDISADAADTLPRHGLRQRPAASDRSDRRNRHRSRSRSLPAWRRRLQPRPAKSSAAAANRTTRRRDRGAQGKTIAGGDVAWRIGGKRRHISGNAAQDFRQRKRNWRDPLNAVQQRREAASSEVSEAGRRWGGIMRPMVDRAVLPGNLSLLHPPRWRLR